MTEQLNPTQQDPENPPSPFGEYNPKSREELEEEVRRLNENQGPELPSTILEDHNYNDDAWRREVIFIPPTR